MLKDVFKYVVSLKNKFLENRLIDLVYSCFYENEYCFFKYYIVVIFNFYDIMLLLIVVMFYMEIDLGDKENILVFFIVVVFENVNILIVLIDNWVDINY